MNKISKHQSGAVLIVSLIMLLLLTLIGASSIQTTSLEEKMAGNLRDRNLAFQAAESALNVAEASLDPPNTLPTFTDVGTEGFYSETSTIPTPTAILTDSFWTTNPKKTSTVTNLGNNILTPLYIIQKIPAACFTPPCTVMPASPYKITVRATGASTSTVVILQTIYSPTT
jgi:type IV pilus assembly protein PilX